MPLTSQVWVPPGCGASPCASCLCLLHTAFPKALLFVCPPFPPPPQFCLQWIEPRFTSHRCWLLIWFPQTLKVVPWDLRSPVNFLEIGFAYCTYVQKRKIRSSHDFFKCSKSKCLRNAITYITIFEVLTPLRSVPFLLCDQGKIITYESY